MQVELFDKQSEVFQSQVRFILVRTGIQAGKTYFGSVWILNEIWRLKQQGFTGDFLIAAPTNKILEQSTLKKFRPLFPNDWGRWNEQKRSFQLNWKNKDGEFCNIYVRSTEKPDFLEGMTILAAWLDEAGRMKEEAWINVQGRLSVFQGRCLMTTTPYAINWVNREVSKRARTDDKDYAEFTWSSVDNPYFPRAEFERMKRVLSEATFRRRYCGDFTRPEGLVYPDYQEDIHVVEPFEIPEKWNRIAGADFGRRNAIICLAKDPLTNIFYAYKEYYAYKESLSQMAKFFERYPVDYTLCDWNASQVISELKREHRVTNLYNADKSPGSVDIGIERITELLKEGRLKFFRTCRNAVDEIENYHHKEESDETPSVETPVKAKDHLMDSLRYAFSRKIKGVYTRFKRRVKQVQKVSRRLVNKDVDPITGY